MKKLRYLSLLLLLINLGFSRVGLAVPQKLPVLDRVVATVNQEAIPESELNRQMNLLMLRIKQSDNETPPLAQLKKQLLDKIILEKIQLQKAEEEGIKIEEKEVDHAIQQIASRDNLSSEQLQEFLEEQGVPFEQFRSNIKNELLISKLQQRELGQNINISPSEIEQFLNSPAGQDQSGAEYHLHHILIALPETPSAENIQKAKKEAQEILAQLRKGADFNKTAMGQSKSQHALNGGDLGWRKAAELPTIFANIVPALQVGEIYGPLQNTSGFHIIKLVDKRIEGVRTSSIMVKKHHVRQILIKPSDKLSDSEAKAVVAKLREELAQGADFTQLARKHSHELSSATKGGDLGWITKGSAFPPIFYQNVAKLQAGQISQPFKSSLGWHLVQVTEIRNELAPSSAMRNRATDLLYQRKMEERLGTWLRRARDEAEVAIYLNGT